MSATRLKEIIADAPEVEIEPPRPLQRPPEPADPFPTEALGDVLGDAALAIVDLVQCPQAEAVRLRAEGRSIEEIAQHLESEPDTVRGWVERKRGSGASPQSETE